MRLAAVFDSMIRFLSRSFRLQFALKSRLACAFFLLASAAGTSMAMAAEDDEPRPAKPAPARAPDHFGAWVETNFPFFSSVLDARKAGETFPKNNLTPRGIVL